MATILIIDDSSSMRLFLEQVLTAAGHTVVAAADGKHGLAHLHKRLFDLVITDLYMPETDGIEMLRRARETGRLGRAIAISSKDSIVNLLPAARMLGAQATLQKPFTSAQLLAVVEGVLASAPTPPVPPNFTPTQNPSRAR